MWQLRAESANTQDVWIQKLLSVCGEEESDAVSSSSPGGGAPPPASEATSIEASRLKMQVPGSDGQPCWRDADFDLQSNGILKFKSEEKWPWDEGYIDIKKALGVWLLGPPGWRRLDNASAFSAFWDGAAGFAGVAAAFAPDAVIAVDWTGGGAWRRLREAAWPDGLAPRLCYLNFRVRETHRRNAT